MYTEWKKENKNDKLDKTSEQHEKPIARQNNHA
jgi:hypothetical protein